MKIANSDFSGSLWPLPHYSCLSTPSFAKQRWNYNQIITRCLSKKCRPSLTWEGVYIRLVILALRLVTVDDFHGHCWSFSRYGWSLLVNFALRLVTVRFVTVGEFRGH